MLKIARLAHVLKNRMAKKGQMHGVETDPEEQAAASAARRNAVAERLGTSIGRGMNHGVLDVNRFNRADDRPNPYATPPQVGAAGTTPLQHQQPLPGQAE